MNKKIEKSTRNLNLLVPSGFFLMVLIGGFGADLVWANESSPVQDGISGKEWNVALDGTGQFVSIQEAIDQANSGDTIFIKAGRYEEDVTVHSKDGLKIVGAGMEQVLLAGLNRVGTLHIGKWPYGATNVEISGMTVQEHGGLGVGIFNGVGILLKNIRVNGLVFGQQVRNVRIENCVVGGSQTTGMAFADSQAILIGNIIHDNDHGVSIGGKSHVHLERNLIKRSLYEAVLVMDASKAILVSNTLVDNGGGAKFQDDTSGDLQGNIIVGTKVGVALLDTTHATWSYNALHNNGIDYQRGRVSTTDGAVQTSLSTDVHGPPGFVAPHQGDYRLKSTSPLIGIGKFAYLGALPPVQE